MSMGTIRNLCVLAMLTVVSVAGCGREQAPVLVPTVIATAPASGALAVVLNTAITAGFSLTMAPATINATTFTLTGPGGVAVAGAVTYAGTTATFTPTAPLAATSVYTATITTGAQSARGSALAANFVWSFTTGAPTVISTVPATGATAVAVNTLVTATFSEGMNPTTINGTTFTLTGPGATPVGGAVTYSGSTATFTPTTILAANTLFTATITTGAKDPAGAALAANFVWTFTTAAPPTVVSTVPVNGATTVALNTTITAAFSEAMNPTTINGTTFTVTGPGAAPVAGAVTYAGTTATFTPTTALAGSTLFTATITTGATDPAGNPLAANFVWTFTTVSQPTVTSTNPARAATNVPINQKITATFSEPMSSSTIIAPGTFALAVTVGGAAVPGAVTYDSASHTAIFTPTASLTASTQFTATVTTAAQNPAGKALASNYVWSFTTGKVATATAPTVLSTDPANAATNVPLNQKIAATFSKPMNPATISAPGTFTVMVTVGGAAVPGAVTYDTASNTAIFAPSSNLTASTQFTATISNAAQDLAGNALITGGVPNPWSFTTGTTLNATAPTVTRTNPADAATNVPINATVNATFSTAMNPTTITTATFRVAVTADGTPISGTVAYEAASQIATFTPSANLAATTQFTATISPGVQDLAGNALAAGLVPNPWNFTTGSVAGGAGPATINLGTAGNFAVMATSSTASTGPVVINGDVGLSPRTSQGIPPAQVNGTIHINDPVEAQAKADLLAAYNDAISRSTNAQVLPGNMGGLTFAPGLYVNSTSVLIMGAGPNNNVTLDAQGDPNAVFIFKMGSTLTTGPASQVILAGGAKPSNIFWQVGTSATIDTTTIFKGNVLAAVSITLNSGGVVEGRLFAGAAGGAASATVDGTSVTAPAP
jgi:ice-binding like protein/Big-like domain-containing protein